MTREAGEQAREMAREAGEQAREAAEHAREAAHRGVIIMRDEVRRAHDRGRFEEMEFDIRIPDFKEQIVTFSKSDGNSMSISKELNEESSSADFTYETSKDEETLQIRVEGNIDSGRVKILLKQPDGSVYNEYTLSSLAGVDWNQTIRLNDPDVPGMAGKWTVSISAEKAKGHYTVRLR